MNYSLATMMITKIGQVQKKGHSVASPPDLSALGSELPCPPRLVLPDNSPTPNTPTPKKAKKEYNKRGQEQGGSHIHTLP